MVNFSQVSIISLFFAINTIADKLLIIFEAILLLVGCAASQLSDVGPPPEYTLSPAEIGILRLQERDTHKQEGDEASGFLPADRNDDSLIWHLALIDSAQYSLDVWYYLWCGDHSGLPVHRVIAGAPAG